MQWRLRSVKNHQQLDLVGVEARQQTIQRDETGAAAEDTIESRAQSQAATCTRIGAIRLEIGIEVPDQRAHPLLSGTMQVGEGIEPAHQSFCMNPAQRMVSHCELSGIVTQHHGVAQEVVRVDAAPGWPPQ